METASGLIQIDHPTELESLGEAASLLGVALALIDPNLIVHWRNRLAVEWFGEVEVQGGGVHCFASHWDRTVRCADCLPVLVFRSWEAREGLRVRSTAGQPPVTYRVTALPVESRDGLRAWVIESMVRLGNLGPLMASTAGPGQALSQWPQCTSAAPMVIDTAGRIVSWPPSASVIFGYQIDEILGRRVDILVPDDRRHELAWLMDEVASRGQVSRFETIRRTKEGRLVPVALSATALQDEAGVLIGRSTIVENLSEVRSLQAQVEAQAQLLSTLVRDLGGAVLSTDVSGKITSWSKETEDLSGASSLDAIGRPIGDVVGVETAELVRHAVTRSRAIRDHRLRWQQVDGSELPVDISSTQLKDGAGQVTGLALIARDARESQRLERQMIRSEKLAVVGSLAAGLAHEIGTPLNVISATAEYILLDQPPEGGLKKELAVIVDETQRIGGLVRELLTFVREAPLARVEVPLPGAIERAIHLVRIPVEKKTVRLETQVPAGLPPVLGDPHGLHQVLINVLLNAVAAVPEHGRIRVVCFDEPASPGGVVIEVHDSGPGIPLELRERVFDPFFTTRLEGTGLGLAVCARIVQSLAGDIRITESPLGGACFVLQFPVQREVRS